MRRMGQLFFLEAIEQYSSSTVAASSPACLQIPSKSRGSQLGKVFLIIVTKSALSSLSAKLLMICTEKGKPSG
jgi:hypothetical protein